MEQVLMCIGGLALFFALVYCMVKSAEFAGWCEGVNDFERRITARIERLEADVFDLKFKKVEMSYRDYKKCVEDHLEQHKAIIKKGKK